MSEKKTSQDSPQDPPQDPPQEQNAPQKQKQTMRRQRQIDPSTHPPGNLRAPPSSGATSVWVGGLTSSQDSGRTGSRTSTGSREGVDSAMRRSDSNSEREYVLVSVKNSLSDSESSSRRSSETGGAPPTSVPHPSSAAHSRSSSNSSSIDPFSPSSSGRSFDLNFNGQHVTSGGNVPGAATVGSSGAFRGVSNGTDVQNLPLAGNVGNSASNPGLPATTGSIPNPTFAGITASNQSAALAGNVGQNTVFFPSVGHLSSLTLAGNAGNLLAGNPMLGGNNLLYGGGAFLPAASSSMAVLPQGGLDPSALLLQQQYALSPDLLAASLAQTLSLSQAQTLDQLQSPAPLSQGQPVGQGLNLSQSQATSQTLSLLQAQAALTQAQPLPQNLTLSQTQAIFENMRLAQGVPQTLSFPQAPDQAVPQAGNGPQNPVLLQTATQRPAALDPASQNWGSQQAEVPSPPMGHSFDVLSAMLAANQAMLPTPLQSPTSPAYSPTAVDPQLLPTESTSGLPPSLTGLPPVNSADLDSHQQETAPAEEQSPRNGGAPDHSFNTSSSLENGDDLTTSGLGSSMSSTPSDSNPTSPNSDLYPLTCEDEGGVQLIGVQPCHDRPSDKGACLRCGKKVYNMEKLGPVKDVLYHKSCFTCVACHTRLNLKNFHHNDADLADLNVYCASHKPSARPKPLDASAVGIRRALTVPRQGRVNEQIRGGPEATSVHLDASSVSIRSAMHAPAPDLQASNKMREGAWFREQRRYEKMPPQDVVRHDEQSQQYEGSRSLYLDQS